MEVPGYTEIRELGHGGTGRVMLAVRDSDGLAVAIKHLSEPLREDSEFVARFRAEALVIRELDSPHTARLLDYVEGPDDAAIVMELVDGVTLRRLLEHEGATGPESALVVLKGALLGLAEAHGHGVVHRDFKPENVLITQEGDSKLVDFGVAVRLGETGTLAGTPSYMAPEQWDDAPAGAATDVYAATLVFYECLTGHRAFHGENVAALAYQHQHVPPPLEEIEEPLRPLIEHGLAKDPEARPESARAFLAELEEAARDGYGDDWELRGRTGLGVLLLPLAALLPKQQEAPVANGSTSLFENALSPAGKFAVTGGLVLATAAAVASAFAILGDGSGSQSGTALPPTASAPPFTPAPASPRTSAPVTSEPTTSAPSPSGPTSLRPVDAAPTSGERVADTPPVTYARPTAPPTRSAARTATRPTASRPTRAPVTYEPTIPSRPRPTPRPPATSPPDDNPPGNADEPPATTRPPATRAPDPEPEPEPEPTEQHDPLISVSVRVSVGLPVLGGDGDGLVDADIGLGLGSSLLGFVVVPGSVLLGRNLVVRRTRKGRDTPNS